NYCKENDVYYLKEPIGFVPFALKVLYKIRDRIEKERDVFEFGSDKYKDMNKKVVTVKGVILAVTGQFDYADSIILNPICADSYRMMGKREIQKKISGGKFLSLMIPMVVGYGLDIHYRTDMGQCDMVARTEERTDSHMNLLMGR
ncbi:hypothetical protein LCGC14_2262920, partial [marine sediment metagenome]